MTLTPRAGILDIAPYVGGEAKIPGVEKPIRLASNESALGPSPKAMAAYHAHAADMFRYPDGGSTALRCMCSQPALFAAAGLAPCLMRRARSRAALMAPAWFRPT